MDHSFIEYMLTALNISGDSSPDGTYPGKKSSLHSSDWQEDIRAACEVKKFMDEMPGGFFIYRADGDGELIYANRALLRLFKCSTFHEFRTLTGNSFRGMVHPEDFKAVQQSIHEQITNSRYDLDYVEYRIICSDGNVCWVEDYGHFIHSESAGDIFYVFAADATEKKNRQNFIQQEHLRRLEVIEGLSINYESILYANLDNDTVFPYRLSSRTERQFAGELQTKTFSWYISDYIRTWVHPDDCQAVTEALTPGYIRRKLAESGTYYINYRVIKDGEVQYLQLRIVEVGNDHHIARIVLGYRRVDEELQHEMEQKKIFEDALNRARLANIARNTFLSNMSHDMRTPLNAIIGFTTLAENHISSPDQVIDYLGQIEKAGKQLLSLVNDVLEISRIESGNSNVEDIEFDLQEFMEQLYSDVLPNAQKKQLFLSLDCTGLKHRDVSGDTEKLSRILMCLSSNAIKYTPGGGHIHITATEQGESSDDYAIYHFAVKDDGIGISPDYHKRIFDAFEREQNTTMSGIHGTGLGLTIARNLAEILGGNLDVQSVPGEGSVFTLTLGLRLKKRPVTAYTDEKALAVNLLKQRKILLVEDNEINLEIEVILLEDLGFSVDTAENGQIAVDMLSASAPGEYALVLMDIQMPVMNGYEAARAIRSLDDPGLSRIPIIALSANAFAEDKKKSQESGMNAHLAKPVDIPKLLHLMVKVIEP